MTVLVFTALFLVVLLGCLRLVTWAEGRPPRSPGRRALDALSRVVGGRDDA